MAQFTQGKMTLPAQDSLQAAGVSKQNSREQRPFWTLVFPCGGCPWSSAPSIDLSYLSEVFAGRIMARNQTILPHDILGTALRARLVYFLSLTLHKFNGGVCDVHHFKAPLGPAEFSKR